MTWTPRRVAKRRPAKLRKIDASHAPKVNVALPRCPCRCDCPRLSPCPLAEGHEGECLCTCGGESNG